MVDLTETFDVESKLIAHVIQKFCLRLFTALSMECKDGEAVQMQ